MTMTTDDAVAEADDGHLFPPPKVLDGFTWFALQSEVEPDAGAFKVGANEDAEVKRRKAYLEGLLDAGQSFTALYMTFIQVKGWFGLWMDGVWCVLCSTGGGG
jgi:hypothetical protein